MRNADPLSDTRVDHKHAPHSAARIVQHPFSLIPEVRVEIGLRMIFHQLLKKRVEEDRSVLRGGGVRRVGDREGGEDGRMEGWRREVIKSFLFVNRPTFAQQYILEAIRNHDTTLLMSVGEWETDVRLCC